MSEKRRDHKNRILKTGESQRKNLTYMYRFQDASGRRCTVYAPTLEELRKKEEEIQKEIQRGILYDGHEITVVELCSRYLTQKVSAKTYSRQTQQSLLNRIQKSNIANIPIIKIKTSMAKEYIISLTKENIGNGTIRNMHVFLKCAFQFAFEDDMIPKNPFDYKFSALVQGKTQPRTGLTPSAQKELLKFISGDTCFSKRLDDVIILMGTGIRIGEFCALTKSDIDFEKGIVSISKQVQRYVGGEIHITDPKTEAGIRKIPMSDEVYQAFSRIVKRSENRRIEPIIDGHIGFLFINYNGKIAAPHNYEAYFRRVEKKFNDTHTMQIRITPHVLRHTFCTNMVRAGINPVSLQYLMGHSNASISYDVYTDKTFEDAEIAFQKALQAM